MLKPGDVAPSFDLPCAFDGQISHLALAGLRSEMVVLFFYPRDFSFICPTEVVGFHKAQPAFKAEHTSIVGVSVDDPETHRKWAAELGGLSYPLLSDAEGRVAKLYGVYDDVEKVAMRATFMLDNKRRIAYAVASAINVGRSVSETLRVVRAIRSGRLCPADWQPGQPTIDTDQKY
ncbi:MAG TPA: redoxin domain-containing protein [Candidatus Binataceae bacterium]|jgi:alkyl hydroperoxide reductase subunit AhpC|nr:redoxin domain-containing protein [Candidatus Binataceae bacterium]